MTDKSGWHHDTTADNVSRKWELEKWKPSGNEHLYLIGRGECNTTRHPPSQLPKTQDEEEALGYPDLAQTDVHTDEVNRAQ